MNDRQPTKPGRALITPEDGTPAFYATITRADEPTDPGTPYNKATQLTDETAAAIGGLPSNPTVNDAFAGINEHTKISSGTSALLGGADTADKALRYINDLVKISPETSALLGGAQTVNEALTALGLRIGEYARFETGQYTGTGTQTKTITFGFVPRVWGIMGRNPDTALDFTWAFNMIPWGVGQYARIIYGISGDDDYTFDYSGRAVSLKQRTSVAGRGLNVAGSTYYYFAIG